MKRALLLAFVAVVAGCAAPVVESGANVAPSVSAATPRQQLDPPDFGHSSRLGIVRQSDSVRVGMMYDDALAVFPAPLGSTTNSDLPPAVPNTYEARGWQTKADGFGAILYKGRVAAAIYQIERTTDDRVAELVRQHRETHGIPAAVLEGTFVRYWFWVSGKAVDDHVLMISATEVQPGRFNATVSVGTVPVMEALGMVPEAAARDQRLAEKLLRKQRSNANPNTANSSNRAGG